MLYANRPLMMNTMLCYVLLCIIAAATAGVSASSCSADLCNHTHAANAYVRIPGGPSIHRNCINFVTNDVDHVENLKNGDRIYHYKGTTLVVLIS
jgi:hypothetical protein